MHTRLHVIEISRTLAKIVREREVIRLCNARKKSARPELGIEPLVQKGVAEMENQRLGADELGNGERVAGKSSSIGKTKTDFGKRMTSGALALETLVSQTEGDFLDERERSQESTSAPNSPQTSADAPNAWADSGYRPGDLLRNICAANPANSAVVVVDASPAPAERIGHLM